MSSWPSLPVCRCAAVISASSAWSQPAGKRRGDLVFGEEVPVLVTAFDQPVGVEQEPVTGQPARGERGEVIF